MANFDEKTGIRYGVISPQSISSNCDYDLYEGPNCTDPHYESAKADIIGGLDIVFEKAGIWNEEKQNDIRENIAELENMGFSLDEIKKSTDNPVYPKDW